MGRIHDDLSGVSSRGLQFRLDELGDRLLVSAGTGDLHERQYSADGGLLLQLGEALRRAPRCFFCSIWQGESFRQKSPCVASIAVVHTLDTQNLWMTYFTNHLL